jgi:hypothetical protein
VPHIWRGGSFSFMKDHSVAERIGIQSGKIRSRRETEPGIRLR